MGSKKQRDPQANSGERGLLSGVNIATGDERLERASAHKPTLGDLEFEEEPGPWAAGLVDFREHAEPGVGMLLVVCAGTGYLTCLKP